MGILKGKMKSVSNKNAIKNKSAKSDSKIKLLIEPSFSLNNKSGFLIIYEAN